jgi:hypothetical protein
MPDDDRFPRYLSPAWRKVLRCLQGRDPAERGDAVTKAVAATIGEWEAVDLASFTLKGDRSAALCETKSDQR